MIMQDDIIELPGEYNALNKKIKGNKLELMTHIYNKILNTTANNIIKSDRISLFKFKNTRLLVIIKKNTINLLYKI